MYIINKKQNQIEEIESVSFKELGLHEREHLQEWIAKDPESLGEELLIIQKEFDGFNDTRERLDLLVLDKQGNLVIIENKLDDTGKDVTWQALKYASYCSSLNNANIKEIFSKYLHDQSKTETAETLLEEFFGGEDYEEKINSGSTQRIIMVAAVFRKEVTSTVLWLINNGLRVQCFKATPYKLNDQLFLTLEQIIPMKEVEDYIISMANKTRDNVANQEELKVRHNIRYDYWTQFIKEMNHHNSMCTHISPSHDAWIGIALGIGGVSINLVVTKNYARVEVYVNRGDKEENKRIFDFLFNFKKEVENEFGQSLVWERMEDKVTSRIKCQLDDVDVFDKEDWPKMNKFLVYNTLNMERSFKEPIKKLKLELKNLV